MAETPQTTRKSLRIHITHTDLDAAGCDVVFRAAFGPADKLYTVNHDRIDDVVKKALYKDIGISHLTVLEVAKAAGSEGRGEISGQAKEELAEAKDRHGEIVLWITDIAPTAAVLDELAVLYEHTDLFSELFVVDHHPTTDWLGNESYAKFGVWREGVCGAWLAYDCGIQRGVFPPVEPGCMSPLREFVNAVDAYDLWKLDSSYRKRGENLNKLFKLYGLRRFSDYFSTDSTYDRSPQQIDLVELMDEKVNGAIAARIHDLKRISSPIYHDKDDNTYMFVLDDAGGLTSQLGHAILEEFEDIDYVVIVRANGVMSLRSREGGVDVSKIAEQFGGGGHPGAAGFKVDTDTFYRFLLSTLL